MSWQPIETAPKDGTGFLGYINYNWVEGFFWDESEFARLSDGSCPPIGFYRPTHWMPLPEPPK